MAKVAAPINGLSEILDFIRRNIQVSREAVCTHFGLNESDYQRLARYLKNEKEFESVGGRAGGGFRLVAADTRFSSDPDASLTITRFLSEPDERLAALRIAELFSGAELRGLLSPRLLNALRSYKRHTLGKDTQPTKAEAAAALVIEYGAELFRVKAVRMAVAHKLGIKHVERWHAGHRSAASFVEMSEFPMTFCGEVNDESPPVHRLMPEKKRYPALESFQQNAKFELLNAVREKGGRVILQLPTGSGKTRIAVDTLREFLTTYSRDESKTIYSVIWCAHQDELCEQAAKTIEDAWVNADESCGLNLIRFFGCAQEDALMRASEDEILGFPTILVTTPIKALKLLSADVASNDLVGGVKRHARLLVIDEAHRAAAPTYKSILEVLAPQVSVIGLTATPYGKVYLGDASTDELLALFNNNVVRPETLFDDFDVSGVSNAKQFLLQKSILARPIVFNVKTGKRLSEQSIRAIGEGELEERSEIVDEMITRDIAQSQDRTQAIYRAVLPLFRQDGLSILYFAPTVQDALTMTFLLRVDGVPAECVHAQTPAGLRQRYIEKFKKGKIRVLCNVEILTTGFDAPRVTHVVIARPTVSRVLYEQIVGRGLRGPKFGGTDTCVIVDCIDSVPAGKIRFGYEYFRDEWAISDVPEFQME